MESGAGTTTGSGHHPGDDVILTKAADAVQI